MLRLNIVSEREMLMVEGVQVIMGRKKVKILYTLQFPMEAVNIHRLHLSLVQERKIQKVLVLNIG
ncbi:hypothetical protein [Treponema denticola]|uniref:hypothetical protein n=1 Tax=Treponema denticola TaxID=158 RepID=UPI0020A42D50|nr:hypothetical protein [Treponema denticola]